MSTLVNTLDELRSSGEQGAALAGAAARLPQRHIGLILGLHNIFTTLANIGYLSTDQIAWPPHTDNPDFDAEAWSSIGLGEEVRNLLPFLPYTEQIEADVVRPFAKPVSYLGGPDLHVRDPGFQEQDDLLIPPQYLRLTEDVGGEGDVLVYDTVEARLAWWGIVPEDESQSMSEAMRDLDWQPATLLSTYAQRILDLEWLPNPFSPGGLELVEARATPPTEQQLPTYGLPSHWYINRVNQFRARQNVYRRYGWPGPGYDRDSALQALETLESQISELEDAMNPDWEHRMSNFQRYHPDWQQDQARALTQFLQTAAGPNAVTSPSFEECHRSAVAWEDRMKRGGTDPYWHGPLD